ncbi:MAG: two-component system, NtrC family, response regulator HydG [Acidobacteriota bacterium]|jgi:Nif-specific regulatory protein
MIPARTFPPPQDSADQLRLVAIAGPLSGEVLPLNQPELTIGRDPSNAICVSDLSLSRRHCTISTAPPQPSIRDLGSSNGTFVNGMQTSEQGLADGDRIQLGESVFLFISRAPGPNPIPVTLTPAQPAAATTRLSLHDLAYLRGGASDVGPRAPRRERDLQALLKISTAMNAARQESEVHRLLIDHLADALPADQLAVLDVGGAEGTVAIQVCRPENATALDVNSSVLRQVLDARVAMLTAESPNILCVPLVARDAAVGVVYATSRRHAAFDDEHLQLAAAIASVAAIAIDNARHVAALEHEAERLRTNLVLEHNLVGPGPRMSRVFDLVKKVARGDVTVLITGETGTGKELVARAIHRTSSRGRRPFVAINCAALAENLLETELFGHERGAFTHAVAQKRGKLEIAHGGTVFLDEIGELAPGLQSKLLRVLQEREVERVGGTRPIPIDVRVISATNRNLAEEVAARRFRDDLYYRLNAVSIETPPLRERREDIPVLAEHFMTRLAAKGARRVRRISPGALRCLMRYDWPGNVRELENAIEHAIVLGSTDEIRVEDLPESLLDGGPAAAAESSRLHDAVRDAKARVIREAFRQAHRSYTGAAQILGVHPNYLHRLIRNLGIKGELER